MKKKFTVKVITTFVDYIEVEAEAEDEAIENAVEMVNNGDYITALGEPETEYDLLAY